MKEWRKAAEEISLNPGVCLLWGAPDSGKTTLAAFVASFCHEAGRKVAVVDADVGQSDIGPPGTIGMGFLKAPVSRLREIEEKAAYFIGSNSPEGLELACVTGTYLMVREALNWGAEVVIVDTTGAVYGRGARKLKYFKFALLRPSYLLVLQRENEMEHLIRPVEGRGGVRIFRLPSSPRARRRRPEERRLFRERAFSRYFSQAEEGYLSLEGISTSGSYFNTGRILSVPEKNIFSEALGCQVLHAERIPEGLYLITRGFYRKEGVIYIKDSEKVGQVIISREEEFRNLLVGLLDEGGCLLGAGILQEIDFEGYKAKILARPGMTEKAREIMMGTLRVMKDGREVGKNVPGVNSWGISPGIPG